MGGSASKDCECEPIEENSQSQTNIGIVNTSWENNANGQCLQIGGFTVLEIVVITIITLLASQWLWRKFHECKLRRKQAKAVAEFKRRTELEKIIVSRLQPMPPATSQGLPGDKTNEATVDVPPVYPAIPSYLQP